MTALAETVPEPRCATCLASPDTHHGNGLVLDEGNGPQWLCEPCVAARAPSCTACGEPIWPGPQQQGAVELHSPSIELGTFHRACLPAYLLRCAWETSRAYGGPEEGGWWYETGLLIAAVPVPIRAEPRSPVASVDLAALHDVEAMLRRSLGGLSDSGSGLKLTFECVMPDLSYPALRPHYE